MSTEEERVASSNRLKNWLFLPALMIPVVTVLGTLFLKGVSVGGVFLLDQKQLTRRRCAWPASRRSSPAGG